MYVMQGIRVPRQTRYVVAFVSDPEILVQHVAHRFLGLRAVSFQAVVYVTVVQTRQRKNEAFGTRASEGDSAKDSR